ncbi:hypothetical protein [Glutamicibacter sp. TV12E]|uniref:hypothetical protein n=1 Tax=Glutamicibacter sp. TV12E TaxID=3446362 RepID=UPI0040349780
MNKIKDFLTDPKNRNYVYGVARAVIALLVVSGFLIPGLDETIMVLIGALLGLGTNELAKRNVQGQTEETEIEGLGE